MEGTSFAGSGFGRGGWCWKGQILPSTEFEIAVTAQALTDEESRWLVARNNPPRGWQVLFRSDRRETMGRLEAEACAVQDALPSPQAMDTGETLITPITRDKLGAGHPWHFDCRWLGTEGAGIIQGNRVSWDEFARRDSKLGLAFIMTARRGCSSAPALLSHWAG